MEINSIKKQITTIIMFKSFIFDRKQKFEQTVTRIAHYQTNLYLKFGSVRATVLGEFRAEVRERL